MKGLFLHNLYASMGNIKLFLSIVFTVAVVVLVTGNATAQELFVYLTITALSINAVASSRKDAISNWNKFEITMPIHRNDVIKSKYLAYVFWVAVGVAIALMVTVITMFLHGNSNVLYGMDNFYSMFVLGIGISLFTGAFFFPIAYLVGIDKSETILMISVLLAMGLAVITLNVLNQWSTDFLARMFLFILFYSIFFVGSYVLTVGIYRTKEI